MIRGQGMPSFRHHDFGNLYIQFDVKFPKRIHGPISDDGEDSGMSAQQIAALESVLPPRVTPTAEPPSDAMTEDFMLESVEASREQARARGMPTEDDEDDMHPGAERVQCASQ